MKKIALLLLAVLASGVGVYAKAPWTFVDGDWLFSINPDVEHEVTVEMYNCEYGTEADVTELQIPFYATYNGSRYIVSALGKCLFYRYDERYEDGNWNHLAFVNLKKVTIPNTVTSIGDYAFADCRSLTSVVIQYCPK